MNTIEQLRRIPRWKRWLNLIVPVIDILALFPFFLVGFVFNYLQFFIPKRITRTLFKDVCFVNGTHFAMATFLFFFSYLFYIIALSIYVSWISVLIGILLIAVCGIVSYYYRKRFFYFLKCLRYELAGTKKRNEWNVQYKILSAELAEWVQK